MLSFNEFIGETTMSGDVATVPSKLGTVAKRILPNSIFVHSALCPCSFNFKTKLSCCTCEPKKEKEMHK
jgi:hypothetical protein